MTRLPSQRTLQRAFGDDAGRKLRRVLDGRDNPRGYDTVHQWCRQCFHEPSMQEQLQCACNEILDGHGVEAIWGSSPTRPIAAYVNRGETYETTLLWNYSTGTVRVTSVGDFVEAYERRHGQLP